MKPLDQYETPESDDLYAGDSSVEFLHAQSLERRLAACREALEEIASGRVVHPVTFAIETLTLTEKP